MSASDQLKSPIAYSLEVDYGHRWQLIYSSLSSADPVHFHSFTPITETVFLLKDRHRHQTARS